MIYLDTHVILWLFARKGEGLSIRALNLIESDTEIAYLFFYAPSPSPSLALFLIPQAWPGALILCMCPHSFGLPFIRILDIEIFC